MKSLRYRRLLPWFHVSLVWASLFVLFLPPLSRKGLALEDKEWFYERIRPESKNLGFDNPAAIQCGSPEPLYALGFIELPATVVTGGLLVSCYGSVFFVGKHEAAWSLPPTIEWFLAALVYSVPVGLVWWLVGLGFDRSRRSGLMEKSVRMSPLVLLDIAFPGLIVLLGSIKYLSGWPFYLWDSRFHSALSWLGAAIGFVLAAGVVLYWPINMSVLIWGYFRNRKGRRQSNATTSTAALL